MENVFRCTSLMNRQTNEYSHKHARLKITSKEKLQSCSKIISKLKNNL